MAPALNPFDFIQNAGSARQTAEQPESDPVPPSARADTREADEVNRLQERVAELEKLVSSLASRPSSRKRAVRKSPNHKK
jgi:hypothetical protein